jgi:uncharacterized membrane protein YbhN (UPF0104 family)
VNTECRDAAERPGAGGEPEHPHEPERGDELDDDSPPQDARPGGLRRRTPRSRRTRILRGLLIAAFIIAVITLLIVLGHPDRLWRRIKHGDPLWLAAAAGVEILSLLGYVMAFRSVVASAAPHLRWRFSVEVTLAGVVATKLIAAAGAGGVALNVWALRAAGLPGRLVAERIVALMANLYMVFVAALLLTTLGLAAGVLPGNAPAALTLLPAVLAAGVSGIAAGIVLSPDRLLQGLRRVSGLPHPLGVLARTAATAMETVRAGIGFALRSARHQPGGPLGAVIYWAGDVAALYCSIHAFGSPTPLATVVASYFIGQLANALPVPGGLGVVDGGLAGSLIAFGTSGGLAVLGVVAYRFISYWLPTAPGAIAYASLLRTVDAWRATPPPNGPRANPPPAGTPGAPEGAQAGA